jgi:cytosine/adenosine deaminase-related metal-dependent hydrolase
MIDELRVARQISGLSEARLYRMTTETPARVLRLPHGEGTIQAGGVADLLLFRDRGLTPARTLLSQVPEAVLVGGELQMVSEDLATAWRASPSRFHPVTIRGRGTMYLRSEIPPIRHGFSLAGRLVTA